VFYIPVFHIPVFYIPTLLFTKAVNELLATGECSEPNVLPSNSSLRTDRRERIPAHLYIPRTFLSHASFYPTHLSIPRTFVFKIYFIAKNLKYKPLTLSQSAFAGLLQKFSKY